MPKIIHNSVMSSTSNGAVAGMAEVKRPSSGLLREHASSLELMQRLLDVGVIVLMLVLAVELRQVWLSAEYVLLAFLAVLVFEMISEVKGIYRSWRTETLAAEVAGLVGVWLVTVVVLMMLGFASKMSSEFSRVAIITWAVLVPIGLAGLRVIYREVLHSIRADGRNSRTVAFAGCGKAAQKMAEHIRAQPWMGLHLLGAFDDRAVIRAETGDVQLIGDLNNMLLRARAGEIDIVYMTLPMHAERRIVQLIDQLADTTASVFVVPNIFVFDLFQAQWSSVGGMPVVSVFDSPFYGINGGVKRLEDIVFGSLILLLVAPLMLAIALGVKITSPGTVLFKQRRYGLNGETVDVWKFRSMTVSENGDKVVQAKQYDARVTPFGAFLRRTSLDELPQFFNVLQGYMSIVGPRPHAVAHNEEYRRLLHGYMLRHKVKPGITGWAQVNGWRGETDTLDKMKGRLDCDLVYVRDWSLWLDIKIIAMTVIKGFVGKNVY
jgi:putative colanic acid biosysnthesis UDP-glucose lipid carrier transferase